jgi:hypothetical protein
MRFYELASGKEMKRLVPECKGDGFAFSPDGRWLLVISQADSSQIALLGENKNPGHRSGFA